jgi:hypothetical protein
VKGVTLSLREWKLVDLRVSGLEHGQKPVYVNYRLSQTFAMVGEMSSWLNYLAPLATPRAQEIDQKYEMEDGSAKPDLSGHNFSCLSWK